MNLSTNAARDRKPAFVVVIPARYASTRLPGKPLLDINGKPMLQHVFEQALKSGASSVHIATDDERIRTVAESFGANVCMTSTEHRSGTDRIHEVATRLGLASDAIVVNVQGDEPLIPPAAIDQVARNLEQHPQAGISSLFEIIQNPEDAGNPNAVKVVCDKDGYALYFSRSTIPYGSSSASKGWARHIGIYAYRVETLFRFVSWPPAEIENQEKLEQLRALYNGIRIYMDETIEKIPPGVDTERDLELVRTFLRSRKS